MPALLSPRSIQCWQLGPILSAQPIRKLGNISPVKCKIFATMRSSLRYRSRALNPPWRYLNMIVTLKCG